MRVEKEGELRRSASREDVRVYKMCELFIRVKKGCE